MGESFALGGDPVLIRGSARQWSVFASAAGSAAVGIRSLDTSDFTGDEAELFREQINSDLPGHLDTACTAWGVVGSALWGFASELERHQREMSRLATRAANERASVSSCELAVERSERADAEHVASVVAARRGLEPGEELPADSYVSSTASDRESLVAARAAWQSTCDAASRVRAEHAESVRRCRAEIDRAKGMRFAKPPGFWGSLKNSVCDWIADHADVLLQISSVLKTISAVAGVLSLIPVLAPVMGPIALATGGAALLIDVGVKVVTGRGSWAGIVIDGATMLLPGVGKVLGKAARGAVPGVVRAAEGAGGRVVSVARNSSAVKAVRSAVNVPLRGLNRLDGAAANGIRNMPGGRQYLGWAQRHGWTPTQTSNALPVRKSPREAAQDAYNRDPSVIDRTRANPDVARRPGRRVATERTVIEGAERTPDGDFICARSRQVVPAARDADGNLVRVDPTTFRSDPDGITVPDRSQMDFGHVEDHEWSFTRVQATDEGWSRPQVIEQQQNPDIWQLEAKGPNRSAGTDARLSNLFPGSPVG